MNFSHLNPKQKAALTKKLQESPGRTQQYLTAIVNQITAKHIADQAGLEHVSDVFESLVHEAFEQLKKYLDE